MADFKRVIQNAINGLQHNTPETRIRVYDRARQTVQRQLDNLPANIDRSTFERQMDRVEAAILEVESQYSDVDVTETTAAPEDVPHPEQPVEDAASDVSTSQHIEHDQPTHAPTPIIDEPLESIESRDQAQDMQSNAGDTVSEVLDNTSSDNLDAIDPPEDIVVATHHHEAEQVSTPLAQDDAFVEENEYEDAPFIAPDQQPSFQTADFEQGAEGPSVFPSHIDDDFDDRLDYPTGIINQPLEPRPETVSADGSMPDDFGQNSAPEPVSNDDADAIIEAAVGQIQSKLDVKAIDGSHPSTFGDKTFGLGVEALPDVPLQKKPKKTKKSKKSPLVILVAVCLVVFMVVAFFVMSTDWGGNDIEATSNRLADEIGADSQTALENDPKSASENAGNVPVVSEETAKTEQSDETGQQTSAAPNSVNSETDQKFTQRLNPDGTEIDMGPGNDGLLGNVSGEGTSIAALIAEDQTGTVEGDEVLGVTENGALIHRMYLYETSQGLNQQARYDGSVVWSENRDASVGNRPYIEAQIQVPDRDIAITLSIKQNSDVTLPVSHLFDISFSLPANFEGGEIEQVVEIKFKNEEEQTGDALQAISAKIDPSFFIVGLQNDAPDIVAANLQLMLQRSWIDIPITYTNGRKALLTLEKGAAGHDIFEKVFAFWEQNPIQ